MNSSNGGQGGSSQQNQSSSGNASHSKTNSSNNEDFTNKSKQSAQSATNKSSTTAGDDSSKAQSQGTEKESIRKSELLQAGSDIIVGGSNKKSHQNNGGSLQGVGNSQKPPIKSSNTGGASNLAVPQKNKNDHQSTTDTSNTQDNDQQTSQSVQQSSNQGQSNFPPSRKQPQQNNQTLEARFEYCCETQGVQKQNASLVTEIDFSLDDVIRMDFLAYFTNLKILTLANQGLQEIEGIDKLKHLEKMWLNCNFFESIRGFDRLINLKELYLSKNRIKRIRNIEKCINLEKLWIDENRIENIDNLQSLHKLEQLNLASNNIETIGMGLDGLVSLSELNLSSNRIGNFKEVLNLNRLPCLTICTFDDPHYGDNPICNLCNYQTYVLYHLPRLHKLDTMYISDEAKNFADSTFMKKRMYYNMRIKTIQRNTSNIMKLLKICRKIRNFKIDIQVSKLIKKLNEITRELEERYYLPQNNKDQFPTVFTYGPENQTKNPLDTQDKKKLQSDLENKKALIQGRIHDRNDDLKELQNLYESLTQKVYEMSGQNIHRLMTEFETGGNIRFEEGKATDKWFTSCVDLVKSRFNAEQMKQFGIYGINVNRVTRIHNRFLRIRFEEKLEQLVDVSDSSYKRSLEYLFYGQDPMAPQEIQRALEEGFRSQQENTDVGLPACTPLVNSVASAEVARISQYLNDNEEMGRKSEIRNEFRMKSDALLERSMIQIPSGQILVCKVYLSKQVHDQNYPFFDPSKAPSDTWKNYPVDLKHYQSEQGVFRASEKNQKQRIWFIMDNALVLPEYLIEFDYIVGNSKSGIEPNKKVTDRNLLNSECNMFFKGVTGLQRVLENTYIRYAKRDNPKMKNLHLTAQDLDQSDMGSLKQILHYFMIKCHVKELMENQYEFLDESVNQNSVTNASKVAIEDSMPPDIPLRNQIDDMNKQILVNISREKDYSQIVYINLFNNKIKKIHNLDALQNLQTLILSFNELEEIDGLSECKNLKKLDLNHNFIRIIQNLENQKSLQILDLTHNWVSDITQIEHLQKYCQSLKELGLKCNPFSTKKSYRSTIFQRLTNLFKLDGLSLSEKDKERVKNDQKALTPELIIDSLNKNTSKNTNFMDNMNNARNVNSMQDGYMKNKDWTRKIEHLKLSHLSITVIANLQSFVNLRKLQLIDNNIIKIIGLDSCKLLEELSLEKNKIVSIENIGHLKYLKKLDLGQNRIKRIINLNNLENLAQLSLEDNEIHHLDGLDELQTLMELYLGNNLIADTREIIKLKELQRLIILDISGNNLCNDNSYRIYCIFHLRKLRVLDGMAIELDEHLEAKETFAGRLTDEILDSRLNNQKMQDIQLLDLSQCKLRDFENMFDHAKYPQLRELNLSYNSLVTMRGFGYLPNLRILKLKQNRLDSLFCKPKDNGYPIGVFGLHRLEYLDVSFNNLSDLHGLQYSPLKELTTLLASNNEIQKVENLEKLISLRELDLSKNKIRSIDQNIKVLYTIVVLNLQDNLLKNLVNLESLVHLQVLLLSGNRCVDFSEVDRFAENPELQKMSLQSNPFSRKPNYRNNILKRLPNLCILDGKEITLEERSRLEFSTMQEQKAPPMVHFSNYPTTKQPVKLNAVNLNGAFNNMNFQGQIDPNQLQQQNQQNKNQNFGGGRPLTGVIGNSIMNVQSSQQVNHAGGHQQMNQQDMNSLIQVQSMHTQQHYNMQQNDNQQNARLPPQNRRPGSKSHFNQGNAQSSLQQQQNNQFQQHQGINGNLILPKNPHQARQHSKNANNRSSYAGPNN